MDEREFERRLRLIEPKLYRAAYAMLLCDADAADAMQDCAIKAWRRLGFLKDEGRFEGWLMRILINHCRDALRRQKHRPLPLDEAVAQAAKQDETTDVGLMSALMALPEKYRLPLTLHHIDGYELDQVCKMLRLPMSTLRGRLYEGRRLLKAQLDKEAQA